MANIFISYSQQDGDFAGELSRALQRTGDRVFIDIQSVNIGANWRDETKMRLRASDAVVLVLSRASQGSSYLQAEAELALTGKKIIFPILLGPNARDNFVWPLVSNRLAIIVDYHDRFEKIPQIAHEISRRLKLQLRGG